jgi:hypothetical protein
MRRRMHKTLILVALTLSSTALAGTPLSDPTLFNGQPSTGFEGLHPANRTNFPVPLMVNNTTPVIATVSAPANTETLLSCPTVNDCYLTAWGSSVGAQGGAVTITFSQPIAAFGIDMRGCDCGWQVTVSESNAPAPTAPTLAGACTAGFVGWQASAGESVTQIVLADGPGASCNDSLWDNLRAIVGSAPSASKADVSLVAATRTQAALPYATVTTPFTIANGGPDAASGVAVTALLPEGVTMAMPAPLASNSSTVAFPQLDLASGAPPRSLALSFTAPDRASFNCTYPYVTVAIAGSQSIDPDQGNNIALASFHLDRAAIASTEDCSLGADLDCDGLYGCADPDCADTPGCQITLQTIALGSPPGPGFGAPIMLPIADPTMMQFPYHLPNPINDPPPPPPRECYASRHGMQVLVPPFCCDGSRISDAQRIANCVPQDPNRIDSDVPTNAIGYGYVTSGQQISYTIDYENIGATDAHGVQILLALDGNFDDRTLTVGNGGAYDATTRLITWIDPVVFPHDPRAVTFSVRVRADAAWGTRVCALATVVFPDAVPPSRIDTNFLEHVVPHPQLPVAPQLAVTRCDPAGGDTYRVSLTNFGFGFAYGASATIVAQPSTVKVTQATVRFANPGDLDPAQVATVVPLATTASLDTVELTAPGGVDCAALTWRIDYTTSAGQPATVTAQALVDANGDGVPDYRQPATPPMVPAAGGHSPSCGCAVGGAAAGERVALVALALAAALLARVVLARRRRAR